MSEQVHDQSTGERVSARKEASTPATPREELKALAVSAINAYPNSSVERVRYVWEHIEGDIELITELFAAYRNSIISALINDARVELQGKAQPARGRGARGRTGGPREPDATTASRPGGGRLRGETTRPDIGSTGALHQRSMLQSFPINGRPLAEVTTAEAYAWLRSHKRDGHFVELVLSGVPENDTLVSEHCTDDEANAFYHRAQSIGK